MSKKNNNKKRVFYCPSCRKRNETNNMNKKLKCLWCGVKLIEDGMINGELKFKVRS